MTLDENERGKEDVDYSEAVTIEQPCYSMECP